MPTLNIKVDLECCRCSTKIQKILCCIQEQCEFVIEKVVYEKDKVTVSGPFDAHRLSCVLRSRAGRIIKDIEVVKPKPDESKPKCKLVYPYPCPPQPCAWPSSCPTPYSYYGCQSKPAPPPPPSKPPACHCLTWSSCYYDGDPCPPPCDPCPSPPPTCPPMPLSCQPLAYPMVVCDDSPPYGTCAVM